MSSSYKKEKRRSALLWIGGGIAVCACLAVIVFLVYTLALRTSYRAFCLEINDALLAAAPETCTVGRNGETYPADSTLLNYYDSFLLDEGTLVFRRQIVPASDGAIELNMGENRLLITPIESGTAVNLQWITPAGTRGYSVRTGYISYPQLNSYYVNYVSRLAG